MVKYISRKEEISLLQLANFVKSVDKDFTPPLTGRVDIEEWNKKKKYKQIKIGENKR